jgi:signal recognition particle receptor subunit beta
MIYFKDTETKIIISELIQDEKITRLKFLKSKKKRIVKKWRKNKRNYYTKTECTVLMNKESNEIYEQENV